MTNKLYNWLTITNSLMIVFLVGGLITTLVLMSQNDTSLHIAIEREGMIRLETDKMIFDQMNITEKSIINVIDSKIKNLEEKIRDKVKITIPVPPKPRINNCEIPNTDYYIVKPNDTLFKIALKYCINLQELIDINAELLTKNSMIIYPGDRILLYW